MKPFDAPGILVNAPDDWFDASTYILAGPQIADGRASLVVTLARKVPDPGLGPYVDRQLPDIKKLQEFSQKGREAMRVANLEAILLEFTWKQPAGPLLRQRQWYVWSSGNVYTLTATAPDAAFAGLIPTFAKMVQTFKPKAW
jgi:hypothetical protein